MSDFISLLMSLLGMSSRDDGPLRWEEPMDVP